MGDFGSDVLLGHVTVCYHRCSGCGFIQTEDPTWLAEAYSDSITHLDVGLLSRCNRLADLTEAVVRTLPRGGRYLDWAGGYGVLTRLLRDRGIDFRHHDLHTANYFAAGWEGDPADKWDLITMYEVLEHLADPLSELTSLAKSTPILLVSTYLLPDPPPPPGTWWYYTPETGQHISFYTTEALSSLAERIGMALVSDGQSLHAIYQRGSLSRAAATLIRHRRASRVMGPVLRRARPTRSLTESDFRSAHRALMREIPPA